jgi:Mg/Co/Ni transporter MgtE
LRERIKEPDIIYFVYVVNNERARQLRGAAPLRDLFIADDARRLEKIMRPCLDALDPLASADEGAYQVIESHLPSLSVVAEDGRLLGEVTAAAAVSHVAPPGWGAQPMRVFS